MTEYLTEVTAISSKGQIVLPKAIRDSLALQPGSKLMVLSDGENILLKPIIKPDLKEFRSMMDQAKKWATDVGLSEKDIGIAIKEVRRAKEQTK
ncbi:MAG TPA: AbrB/MazE/SpoVT family DNA-binding domain-containing protein [Clostridia bacterium]|nr:AbrB/MazE/SpoVT family DNA-binding domain-containing protein [Clostridia bacterium]